MIAYILSQLVRLMGKKAEYDLSNMGLVDEEFSTILNGKLTESIIGMIIFVAYFVASILLSVGAKKGCYMIMIRFQKNNAL